MVTRMTSSSTTEGGDKAANADAALAVTAVPVHDGDVLGAHAAALDACEPRFVSASLFADDRGWSIMNQLKGVLSPTGQVNFSLMYPGVIKAWHRHAKQTDFWLVTQGMLKVGVYDDVNHRAWMIMTGERRPGVVVIPPSLWHGGGDGGSFEQRSAVLRDAGVRPGEPGRRPPGVRFGGRLPVGGAARMIAHDRDNTNRFANPRNILLVGGSGHARTGMVEPA